MSKFSVSKKKFSKCGFGKKILTKLTLTKKQLIDEIIIESIKNPNRSHCHPPSEGCNEFGPCHFFIINVHLKYKTGDIELYYKLNWSCALSSFEDLETMWNRSLEYDAQDSY